MEMQDYAVEESVAGIAKKAVSTERVVKDMLANSDFSETILTTRDARVQSAMDQKLTANYVQNAMEY